MKKFFFLLVLLPVCVCAQPDSLGQWPFLYYYDFPEMGMWHDSTYCSVHHSSVDGVRFVNDTVIGVNMDDEFAFFMHTDDTIRVAGIAYMTYWSYGTLINRLSFYDNDMGHIATVKNSVFAYQDPANNYANIDSGYYHLCVPGNVPSPCYIQPLRLTFFENDSILDICGDFWIGGIWSGSTMPLSNWHFPHYAEFMFLNEVHQPPYHFHPRRVRRYLSAAKEWEELPNILSLPLLFPIIIPPCVGADSVRTWVDSTGCLHAEWDSLRWQEQWVVALRADGLAEPLYDTVGSCSWSYCGLDSGAAYNVSVQSRCWNPGDRYTWSPFSHRTGTLGIAQPTAPTAPVLRLSPNPAKNMVRVECSAEVLSLTVADALGRTVLVQPQPSAAQALDIGNLQAGIYTVVAATPQGTATARLVVESFKL